MRPAITKDGCETSACYANDDHTDRLKRLVCDSKVLYLSLHGNFKSPYNPGKQIDNKQLNIVEKQYCSWPAQRYALWDSVSIHQHTVCRPVRKWNLTVHMHECMLACMYLFIHVCIHVCMFICMYVFMHVLYVCICPFLLSSVQLYCATVNRFPFLDTFATVFANKSNRQWHGRTILDREQQSRRFKTRSKRQHNMTGSTN